MRTVLLTESARCQSVAVESFARCNRESREVEYRVHRGKDYVVI